MGIRWLSVLQKCSVADLFECEWVSCEAIWFARRPWVGRQESANQRANQAPANAQIKSAKTSFRRASAQRAPRKPSANQSAHQSRPSALGGTKTTLLTGCYRVAKFSNVTFKIGYFRQSL